MLDLDAAYRHISKEEDDEARRFVQLTRWLVSTSARKEGAMVYVPELLTLILEQTYDGVTRGDALLGCITLKFIQEIDQYAPTGHCITARLGTLLLERYYNGSLLEWLTQHRAMTCDIRAHKWQGGHKIRR